LSGVLFRTERLEVVSLSAAHARAATDYREEFAAMLDAEIDDDWPLPDFAEYLPVMARTLERDAELMAYGGVIILREPRIVIGEVGLHGAPRDGRAEVGYSIVPSRRKRGIATEALQGLMKWSYETLAISRLAARCLPENHPSKRVLEKNGFRFVSGPDREGLLHYTHVREQ
jgi:[ribosomal protein S5]-alanine N-acetyltransferase